MCLYDGALNDHQMSFLFRGLTRSSSIENMALYRNELSVTGVRCMVPFLQNADNLACLVLDNNNIQSEGFNLLLRTLHNSPIERLYCSLCGIESIEMDNELMIKHLKTLQLSDNKISSDGCRGLAKLLQGRDATLETLCLQNNKIDDEGVEILVDALQGNKSLDTLYLMGNHAISKRGKTSLLKLVNDISSIDSTLRSNYTLAFLSFSRDSGFLDQHLDLARKINWKADSPEAAGRQKVIQTQLNSKTRADLAELQGVDHSVYSEINPLHLPEVLALVDNHHGQGELFKALKSTIAELISTVNRKQVLHQQRAYYRAKLDEIEEEIAAMEAEESVAVKNSDPLSGNKRRRA